MAVRVIYLRAVAVAVAAWPFISTPTASTEPTQRKAEPAGSAAARALFTLKRTTARLRRSPSIMAEAGEPTPPFNPAEHLTSSFRPADWLPGWARLAISSSIPTVGLAELLVRPVRFLFLAMRPLKPEEVLLSMAKARALLVLALIRPAPLAVPGMAAMAE